MNWIPLTSPEQLAIIQQASFSRTQVIFKHSTRCSISSTVLSRLERGTAPEAIDFYFLDLLNYRPLSAQIAEQFRVHHESPQVLLIRNGECIYDESHTAITPEEIAEQAAA